MDVATAMPKNKSINLLPQEEFEASTIGRILKWAMGTFRIIVIVTEMVVMGAFLSRFWLDAQNSDLNDEIRIKNAQISAQSDFEKEFRNLQSKLGIIKTLNDEKKSSEKINIVSSKIPSDVVLTSLTIESGAIQVKGVGNSESGVSQFITNLKSDKSLKSVDLASINSSEENPLVNVFTLKINY